MNTQPIVPASLSFTDEALPYSDEYEDIYHPRAGAFAQARHVFLAGNGLPQRWQQRERFVVLETGFGLGHNFLATWDAWRRDTARCGRLVFISIEKHPLRAEDMLQAHRPSPAPALSSQLVRAWPPLTHNLHSLSFEDGGVQLLLALGDVSAWLPELVAEVDAFFLDGFAPARNPQMWQPRIFKALARLAAPGATLATWTAAGAVREGLRAAGFEVRKAPGSGGKRDITLARYAPSFSPRRAPARLAPVSMQRHALVVGAGLAGCAVAAALAHQGWSSTVYDRRTSPAAETSGNPAGLFHGIVNAQDGTHARFNRAAALRASVVIGQALRDGVCGNAQGLLRLENDATTSEMQAMLERLGLPLGYVQALSPADAGAHCGLALRSPAWFYPGGGWVDPAGLALYWLRLAGASTAFRGGVQISRLASAHGEWQLLGPDDAVIDEAETVVLANAGDAMRLLRQPAWPVEAIRGQLSMLASRDAPGFALPRLPVAGSGYLLPETRGRMIFGATSQVEDGDPSVREADHAANVEQLHRLTAARLEIPLSSLEGRTGWRWTARDRLPLLGAVPDDAAPAIGRPLDQPRFVPRLRGLYVFTALGSRGITWAPLGAETLAAWIAGAPVPLESSLLDAVDPARFLSRAVRRQHSGA